MLEIVNEERRSDRYPSVEFEQTKKLEFQTRGKQRYPYRHRDCPRSILIWALILT